MMSRTSYIGKPILDIITKLQNGTSISCSSGTNVIFGEDKGNTVEIISENGKIGYISYAEWIQNFKEYDPFLLN